MECKSHIGELLCWGGQKRGLQGEQLLLSLRQEDEHPFVETLASIS